MIAVTVKQPGKVTMLHICIVIFLGCFFFGVFSVDFWMRDQTLWLGYVLESRVHSLKDGSQAGQNEVCQIVLARAIPWSILLLTGEFRVGRYLKQLWFGWLGFAGGFLFAAFLCRYGFGGIWYMLICGFPQIPVYTVAYIVLVILQDEWIKLKWSRRNQLNISSDVRKASILLGMFLLLNSGIYLLGMWMECSICPWIFSHMPIIP